MFRVCGRSPKRSSARQPCAPSEDLFQPSSRPFEGCCEGFCAWVASDVLGAALPPRLDFSIVDTFAYSRVLSEHLSSPRFGSQVFSGGGIPTWLTQARLPRETILLCWGASPPVDAVGRLALSASTNSRINRCHEGTLIHARTLWLGRRVQLLSLTLALASDQKLCSGFSRPMDLISTILPVVTKDLPISPRFTPYVFLSRCKSSNLTTRQPMVKFHLLTFPRFPLRKKDHKSHFGETSRIELTTSALAQQVCGLPTRPLGRRVDVTSFVP